VGEALTALPACHRLRAATGSAIALTYTSPSAERWPGGWPVDRADYLPPDLPGPMQAMLTALRPRLVVYSRADVWPALTAEAIARGVPVAILGATVGPRSGRLHWPVRSMLHALYAAMAYVGAASRPDAERLARLGVRPGVLDLTGDATAKMYKDVIAAAKGSFDIVTVIFGDPIVGASEVIDRDDPELVVFLGGAEVEREEGRRLHARGVPVFPTPERGMRALAQLARFGLPGEKAH